MDPGVVFVLLLIVSILVGFWQLMKFLAYKDAKTIFLVCPVRMFMKARDELSEAEKTEMSDIRDYVSKLEIDGYKVYWPYRDTNQEDPIGLRICQDNLRGMKKYCEVHIWWNKDSFGSHFDFGMAFALGKKIVLANTGRVEWTDKKSFNNVLLTIAEKEAGN